MISKKRLAISQRIQEARRREKVVLKVLDGRMTNLEAAEKLNLSSKTVYRLCANYRRGGFEELLSKKGSGRSGNRSYNDSMRQDVRQYVRQQRRKRIFTPKELNEGLYRDLKINIAKETLRLWMVEWRLWKPNRRNKKKRSED